VEISLKGSKPDGVAPIPAVYYPVAVVLRHHRY
jgi:hypothetical protein